MADATTAEGFPCAKPYASPLRRSKRFDIADIMEEIITGRGRRFGIERLTKPMLLRLTPTTEAHINAMARVWGIGRQDAVRRIVQRHMEAKE